MPLFFATISSHLLTPARSVYTRPYQTMPNHANHAAQVRGIPPCVPVPAPLFTFFFFGQERQRTLFRLLACLPTYLLPYFLPTPSPLFLCSKFPCIFPTLRPWTKMTTGDVYIHISISPVPISAPSVIFPPRGIWNGGKSEELTNGDRGSRFLSLVSWDMRVTGRVDNGGASVCGT